MLTTQAFLANSIIMTGFGSPIEETTPRMRNRPFEQLLIRYCTSNALATLALPVSGFARQRARRSLLV